MNGFINVLKPTGMTSHDVVNFIRKTLNIKKVGHAGTLDPNACGVLPICIGKATKMSEIIINGDKEYICELILGKSTDTQDMYGNIINSKEIKRFENSVERIEHKFVGKQYQKPPMYSALKYKGKKLYEYARQNVEVDKPARLIEIKDIKVLRYNENKILLKISCSKGTYIRTLCNDIAEYLGNYGHMGILIRTKSKDLKITDSLTLKNIQDLYKLNEIENHIINIDDIVKMQSISVSNENYIKLINGNVVEYKFQNDNIKEPFYVYCNKKLIGLGIKVDDNKVKIKKMLI